MTARQLPQRISLVLSDVDGTLVTSDKLLTERAKKAVRALRAAGVRFSVASSRPPFGLRNIVGPLAVDAPFAGFNGGLVVAPDGAMIAAHYVPRDIAAAALSFFEDKRVQAWAFTSTQWLCRDPDGAYVGHEQGTISQAPTLVESFDPYLDGLGKIVGVSADFEGLAQCEKAAQERFGAGAMVARSQAYYLDITNLKANKAEALRGVAASCGVALSECVAIGDGGNDAVMLATAGYGIAMGNAVEPVKAVADFVTTSNEDEGFARAIEHILEGLR